MSRKQARFGQPAVYNSSAPTLSDGEDSALNVDSSGNLKVNITTNTGSSGSTSTVTQVTSSATNVTLQAANTSRKELIIYNDSTSILYIKFGATASSTSYTLPIPSQEGIIEDRYTGRVDGIWVSANGNAYVTEVS